MTGEIERIAAGLTEAQRQMIRQRHGPHCIAVSPEVEPLWVAIRKDAPDAFSISLNERGEQVREFLEGHK